MSARASILPIQQVDAFTERVFGGNPAALCPVETWPPPRTYLKGQIKNPLSFHSPTIGASFSDIPLFLDTAGAAALGWALIYG
jgi:hypothetical protein